MSVREDQLRLDIDLCVPTFMTLQIHLILPEAGWTFLGIAVLSKRDRVLAERKGQQHPLPYRCRSQMKGMEVGRPGDMYRTVIGSLKGTNGSM